MGSAATEKGYTQIPVYTYTENTLEDYLLPNGCRYLEVEGMYNYLDPSRWTYLDRYILPIFKDGLIEGFNLTDYVSDDWYYAYYELYTDELSCEIYQGDPMRYNFTSV